MMNKLYWLLIISVLLSSCTGLHYRRGVADFNELQYAYAVEDFNKSLEKGPYKDASLFLAESYYNMNNPKQAVKYYREAYGNTEFSSTHLLHYAHVLRNLNQQDSARIYLEKYTALYPEDERAQNLILATRTMENLKADTSFSVEPFNLKANGYASFSPLYYDDGILFASDRKSNFTEDKITGWTGNPFLNVFFARRDKSSDSLYLDTTFNFPHNSKFHDGPVAYDSSRQNLYITRSNYYNSRLYSDSAEVNNPQLFISKKQGDSWGELKLLDLNADASSTGHPAVSLDGSTLYFSCNKPGGFGDSDLYKAKIKDDGSLSDVENLGDEINTEGNEVFPTIVKNEEDEEILYFSSNGKVGLGGLDIYYINLSAGDMEVMHLRDPINSEHDDFGLIADKGMETGYFSTNRDTENNQTDEIWTFTKRAFFIKVLAIQKSDRKPLDSVEVVLVRVDASDGEMTKNTEEDGLAIFPADFAEDYKLNGSKEGYIPDSTTITTYDKDADKDTIEVLLILERRVQAVGDEAIVLNHIFYDFNKSSIRMSAIGDMRSLAKLMEKYPELEIMLTAHTDCRGSNNYNLELSRKRAEAAKEFLIENGIASTRIKTEGKGETMLLNDCDCTDGPLGQECTEAYHQLNRRTTFRATNLEQIGKPVKYEKIDIPSEVDEAPFAD